MKKLLILVLVLGLTSSASALITSLGGPTEVMYDGSVTINVISDTDYVAWFGYIGFDPAEVGVSACVATSNAGDDSIVTLNPYGWTGYYEIEAGDQTEPYDSVLAGVQFEITVMGGGLAKVGSVYTIDLYDSNWTTPHDTVQVTVIPEPMTVALLGLGGLFLLRRRK